MRIPPCRIEVLAYSVAVGMASSKPTININRRQATFKRSHPRSNMPIEILAEVVDNMTVQDIERFGIGTL
jgi:hypothetical protein